VLGRRACIDLMLSGAELHIMNSEIINKSNDHWIRYEIDEERWEAMIPQERERERSKGELFMCINPTHIPKIIIIVYKFIFVD